MKATANVCGVEIDLPEHRWHNILVYFGRNETMVYVDGERR